MRNTSTKILFVGLVIGESVIRNRYPPRPSPARAAKFINYMFSPQFDSHQKSFTLSQIKDLLCQANLVPDGSSLNSSNIQCYCEDNQCCCLPESLTYTWATIMPNRCETCGATGSEPCKTKSNKRTAYHKARAFL